jgi:hypothetical protein
MKNIIILFILTLFAVSCNNTANAQASLYSAGTGGGISNITANKFDTLTNTTAKYFITKAGALNATTSANFMQWFTARTLTGTPATVTVVRQGSMDGVTWYPLTGVPGTDGRNCDTLTFTPTTARQYKMTCNVGSGKYVYSTNFTNTGGRWFYQRLLFIPSGTQTLRVSDVYTLSYIK